MFVDFSLYSPELNRVAVAHLAFEFAKSGMVIPLRRVVVMEWRGDLLAWLSDGDRAFVLLCKSTRTSPRKPRAARLAAISPSKKMCGARCWPL